MDAPGLPEYPVERETSDSLSRQPYAKAEAHVGGDLAFGESDSLSALSSMMVEAEIANLQLEQ